MTDLPPDAEHLRRAVTGSHCYPGGPELTEELVAAIHATSAPGMTPDAGARRFPYRREPYGRATIPTRLGPIVVDGKVLRTENGPLVEFWRNAGSSRIIDVFIPAAWVQPIAREDSGWVDAYDITDQ